MRTGYRGKRAFDLVLLVVSAVIWLPLLLLTAVAVRIFIGSPVFFRQRRPGLWGKLFPLVKFRTMRYARDPSGAVLPDGERLTRFGRALRLTSLDELPEIFNVLRGEMSFVGPRPLLKQYLPLYSERHRRRHDVVPGLTGLAQVRGRNTLSWHEKFDIDVEYVEQCSLVVDIAILAKTVWTVLTGRGVSASGNATMPPFTG